MLVRLTDRDGSLVAHVNPEAVASVSRGLKYDNDGPGVPKRVVDPTTCYVTMRGDGGGDGPDCWGVSRPADEVALLLHLNPPTEGGIPEIEHTCGLEVSPGGGPRGPDRCDACKADPTPEFLVGSPAEIQYAPEILTLLQDLSAQRVALDSAAVRAAHILADLHITKINLRGAG